MLAKLPAIVEFYTSIYGPYPFNAVGAIVDNAKDVGYSLETQTKPVFGRMPDEATLAHELSHMWYGDSVTLTTWPDIWLHEGFATWSEWIWSEHPGNKTAPQCFDNLYNTPAQDTAFWTPPPGDPGSPVFLFNGTIYYRGAMTLQALRQKVGDFAFFRIMRDWATQNRYGNVTTPSSSRSPSSAADAARPLLRRLALPAGEADRLVGADPRARRAQCAGAASWSGDSLRLPSGPSLRSRKRRTDGLQARADGRHPRRSAHLPNRGLCVAARRHDPARRNPDAPRRAALPSKLRRACKSPR